MRRINTKVTSIITLICFFISGCTAMTTMSSKQSNVSLTVQEKTYSSLPAQDSFVVKTFGCHEFLVKREGSEPLYGILPLDLSIRNLILDILFFTPLMFFNLRQVFPFYEFDIDKKSVRYSYDKIQWWETQVQPEESEYARNYFKETGKKEAQYLPENDKIVADNKLGAEITTGNNNITSEAAKRPNQSDTSLQPEEEWLVSIDGKQYGPYKTSKIKELLSSGKITDKTYVWKNGMANWKRISDSPFAKAIETTPQKTSNINVEKTIASKEVVVYDAVKTAEKVKKTVAPN